MNATSIVLAGGASQRLGRNKASEKVGDESLIQRVVNSLVPFSTEILVVVARNQAPPPFFSTVPTRVVSDVYPGKGALGGIYTGLKYSVSWHNVVVACDMPFLNSDFLAYMVEVLNSYDMAIPRIGENVEPLHAVYTRGCMSPMDDLLRQDKLAVAALLKIVKVRFITEAEIDRFDPNHVSFLNINTESDLIKAREMVKQHRSEPSDDKCRRGPGKGTQLCEGSRGRA